MNRVLVTGACGQLGSELAIALSERLGAENVVVSDITPPVNQLSGLSFEALDVLDKQALHNLIGDYKIEIIYHLAALLSATGEKHPKDAWTLNIDGLINVLETSRQLSIKRVFWPSSIAAFGKHSESINTPQHTVMDPDTVYGISKLAGELWCQYYHTKYGMDIRSLRYPGLISYNSPPGGGTTDYAVAIFHSAVKGETYTSFLNQNTRLPMMYMPDAVKAAINLMQAPVDRISIRTSYNLAAFSITPGELTEAIKAHIPEFKTLYKPDYRDHIARTWPETIDDTNARSDWDWQHDFELDNTVDEMIKHLAVASKKQSASGLG